MSRDLDELGVIKVRVPGGQSVYALPAIETDRIAPFDQLRRVLGEWVAEVAASGNLVVLRTPPGCAHVVASALDRSGIDGLLGTVAGDDTLLCVAAPDDRAATSSPATTAGPVRSRRSSRPMTEHRATAQPAARRSGTAGSPSGPADALMAYTVEPAVRPPAVAGRHRRLARPRRGARPRRAAHRRRARRGAGRARHRRPPRWPPGAFEFVAVRRGHPHRRRAAGHRAGRPGRGQAAHRPQPQRPGRHRPAAVVQARAAGRRRARRRAAARCCSAGPTRPATTYLPGYTHLQRAQPVLLAHHLLAHGWALARDVDRLLATIERLDVSPLGAGALAGTSLPIDPAFTAADLGFARPFDNSLDAVSDRDFVAEALFDLALARRPPLAPRRGVGAVDQRGVRVRPARRRLRHRLVDAAAEEEPRHRRARAGARPGRLIGNLTGLLATLKGLPLAYNRDLQEDKEPLFDSVDQVSLALVALAGMIATATFVPERMAAAADAETTAATDLAEWLVRAGTPFRDAHAIVGEAGPRALDDRDAARRTGRGRRAPGPDGRRARRPGRRACAGGRRRAVAGPRPLGVQLAAFRNAIHRRRRSGVSDDDTMTYRFRSRVRYGECDMQGVVFNAHYLAYCDDAIAQWFKAALPPDAMYVGDNGDATFDFMVKKAVVRGRGGSTFGDVIDLDCTVERWGSTSFDVVVRGSVNGGERVEIVLTYVSVSPGTHRPCRGARRM